VLKGDSYQNVISATGHHEVLQNYHEHQRNRDHVGVPDRSSKILSVGEVDEIYTINSVEELAESLSPGLISENGDGENGLRFPYPTQ
jgi:hypothetical protein